MEDVQSRANVRARAQSSAAGDAHAQTTQQARLPSSGASRCRHVSLPCANSIAGNHPTWRRKIPRAIAENVDSKRFLNKHRIFAANSRRMFLWVRRLGRGAIFSELFLIQRVSDFHPHACGSSSIVRRLRLRICSNETGCSALRVYGFKLGCSVDGYFPRFVLAMLRVNSYGVAVSDPASVAADFSV